MQNLKKVGLGKVRIELKITGLSDSEIHNIVKAIVQVREPDGQIKKFEANVNILNKTI